jgi:hypothetical protein
LVPFSPEHSVFPSVVKKSKNESVLYKTIILPVILYGCGTWSLTREEHRLREFENKVLSRIFVQRKDEVTGGWRIM